MKLIAVILMLGLLASCGSDDDADSATVVIQGMSRV